MARSTSVSVACVVVKVSKPMLSSGMGVIAELFWKRLERSLISLGLPRPHLLFLSVVLSGSFGVLGSSRFIGGSLISFLFRTFLLGLVTVWSVPDIALVCAIAVYRNKRFQIFAGNVFFLEIKTGIC